MLRGKQLRCCNCAKQHILQLETETRKNNIVVEGMPEMTGESTGLGPVLKLFNEQLELDIKSSNIDKAHRFGLSFNNKPRQVRFFGIATRDLVLRHVKKLRESRSQIYVNEDLPPPRLKNKGLICVPLPTTLDPKRKLLL